MIFTRKVIAFCDAPECRDSLSIWLESAEDSAITHLRAAGWSLHNSGEVHRCPTHARYEPTEPGVYQDGEGQIFQALSVPDGIAWRVLLAPRVGQMGMILHEPWNQLPLTLQRLVVDDGYATEVLALPPTRTEVIYSGS